MLERRLAGTAALGTALLLSLAAIQAARGAPASEVVLAIALSFVPYAGLLRWNLAADPHRAQQIALLVASTTGLVLLLAPPALSDDVFRYLWDGRVLDHGLDPYAFAPDDPALVSLRDDLHGRINNPEVPTIYPPLAQIVFGIANAIAHTPTSMKLAALIAHLATTPIVARLAGEHASHAVPLHALNPLALEEAALNGHVDAFVGLFLALALLAWTKERLPWVGLAIGAATGIKLIGLALTPLLLRRRMPLVIALVLGICAVFPVAMAGHGRRHDSGLAHYARRWRGNAGGYALIEGATHEMLDRIGLVTDAPPGWIRVGTLRPWLDLIRGTVIDPRGLTLDPKKAIARADWYETRELSELCARAIAFFLVFAVALRCAWRKVDPHAAALDVLWMALLFSPQVHPWYLVWLLPLEIAKGRNAALVWSSTILIAYAPIDRWMSERVWQEPTWTRVLEYTIVVVVIAFDRFGDCARRFFGRTRAQA